MLADKSSRPTLEVRNLNATRGDTQVLYDIQLSLAKAEVLLIIGPSGSGKSSLLRCLNRLQPIPRGTVFLDGEDITKLPVLTLRQRIGMVFQKAAAFEGSVADNIRFGPALRGEKLSDEAVRQFMRQAALEETLFSATAEQLSGGQEQRLCIARALANRPQILLLDEPTSALDPVATHSLEKALLRLRDEGLALLWVSHDVAQAERVADRILLLEEGQVSWVGGKEAMSTDPGVQAFKQGLSRTEAGLAAHDSRQQHPPEQVVRRAS